MPSVGLHQPAEIGPSRITRRVEWRYASWKSLVLSSVALAMTDYFPKILFCTSEIPQSVNAGSMQLFRALKDYPGDRLLVMGPPPELDAELLPCRYEPLKLLTYRLACTRFRSWTTGLNALNTLSEPQIG